MTRAICLLLLTLFNIHPVQSQENGNPEVEYIDSFDNLYHYQRYYIAGQPSLEAFRWLRDQGVTRVVNLRSEGENEDFAWSSFDEQSVLGELGMKYLSVPVSGRDGYSPENLDAMARFLEPGEQVLIHCGGAGRATSFLMAYLVRYEGYTLDQAVDVGQEMTFFLPLESLLDIEIGMEAAR